MSIFPIDDEDLQILVSSMTGECRCGAEMDIESSHERDSSNDMAVCAVCTWSYSDAYARALQARWNDVKATQAKSGGMGEGRVLPKNGPWLQTASGRAFHPLAPSEDEIVLSDIALALSRICRYGGHPREFYSVAEHSIRCAEIVPDEHRLAALLHDASEAYLGDMIRPLKMISELGRTYGQIERRVQETINRKFGLEPGAHKRPEVLRADNILLLTEKRDLLCIPPKPWENIGEMPLESTIVPLPMATAEKMFIDMATGLLKGGVPEAIQW